MDRGDPVDSLHCEMKYNPAVTTVDLQSLCEAGQQELMRMDYLAAERTLLRAEAQALEQSDFETLSRLYMPLQESRRQRRQHCGEGVVRLDIVAADADVPLDPKRIVEENPHGQLLVAGWASIDPAVEVRRLQMERSAYVEAFLAAVYPIGAGRAVVIVPTAEVRLPGASVRSVDELLENVPPHSIVLNETELPRGPRPGDTHTFAQTMALWERLHAPFLSAADAEAEPLRRIHAYRRAIDVDYACELAHQRLSHTARRMAQQARAAGNPPR